jgi:hypothetical protein
MFGWKKKKVEPEVKIEQAVPVKDIPRVIFEIQDDGSILVACSWPLPESNEQAVETITAYAQLATLINTGKLLHGMQQAIKNYGKSHEINQRMSNGIIANIEKFLEATGNGDLLETDNDEQPLIKPSEAFAVRGGGNGPV